VSRPKHEPISSRIHTSELYLTGKNFKMAAKPTPLHIQLLPSSATQKEVSVQPNYVCSPISQQVGLLKIFILLVVTPYGLVEGYSVRF
jgi:hypothetical protein